MNQNTTIETIREAIEVLYKGDIDDRPKNTVLALFGGYEWVTNDEGQPYRTFGTGGSPKFWLDAPEYELLRTICLANRLEAAPQPPVEQSEPKSGVWINGEWREFKEADGHRCPWCQAEVEYRTDCVSCGSEYKTLCARLAPPAVIEPEPELDEFEKWAIERRGMSMLVSTVLAKYREIISRKGDK